MSHDFLQSIKENEGIIHKLVNIYAEKDNGVYNKLHKNKKSVKFATPEYY